MDLKKAVDILSGLVNDAGFDQDEEAIAVIRAELIESQKTPRKPKAKVSVASRSHNKSISKLLDTYEDKYFRFYFATSR